MGKAKSCAYCTPDKRGNHQPGCPNEPGGGSQRRSRKKGTPRGRKPGDILIAAHTSDWQGGNEYRDSRNNLWVSLWTCSVCGRQKENQSRNQNTRPPGEFHPSTEAK